MNVTGNTDVSKMKLERRFYDFELNYGKMCLMNMLKNWYYWLILLVYLVGMIVFNVIFLSHGVDHDRVKLSLIMCFSFIPLLLVLSFFLVTRGKYTIAYGKAVAYKTGEKQISIVSKGKYDFEKIVTIKVSKITKFHSYYCLAENYFRYVFVPLDFPIDEISKPIIEESSEQTSEEIK